MQERETDRQTESMTLAEPTPDMTERNTFQMSLRRESLRVATRSVEQSL